MARIDEPDMTDRELFRAEVGPVKRLPVIRLAPAAKPPPARALQRRVDDEQVVLALLADEFDPADIESGEELSFARPGLQHSLLRRLRRGHFAVRAQLDLHGMTVPVARMALAGFLQQCRTAQWRCVRIIHGKGRRSRHRGPVLKGKVDKWLTQCDEVLAFCSARPVDGGTGAVYVLLKSRR